MWNLKKGKSVYQSLTASGRIFPGTLKGDIWRSLLSFWSDYFMDNDNTSQSPKQSQSKVTKKLTKKENENILFVKVRNNSLVKETFI